MMSKQNPFSEFFSANDFSKLFQNMPSVPFGLEDFMETQRKNMQALTDAQQVAIEGLQTIAQRQSAILSEMVEDNAQITQEFMNEGTPEEKIAKNADLFKTVYERNVKNMNEISELLNKSNQEASDIINKRVKATMNEVKASLDKAQKKAA
ncbi:MAG: phasin family protein [Rhodospirillales bacterium]|nr:phasin family protein [Rhodospirillales bacterium]